MQEFVRPSAVLALVSLTLATPVFAQAAIDGDTIKLDGMTYRLWGIDAPESKQACGDGPASPIVEEAERGPARTAGLRGLRTRHG